MTEIERGLLFSKTLCYTCALSEGTRDSFCIRHHMVTMLGVLTDMILGVQACPIYMRKDGAHVAPKEITDGR